MLQTLTVVDAFFDVDTGACAAALAHVESDTESSPVHGLVDVCVVENNVGRLAAEFEGNLLEVRLSSSLHDGAADEGRAGEGDLLDSHMRGNGSTDNGTEAVDNVDDTRWENLGDILAKLQGREGSLFGSLHSIRPPVSTLK